ncbi:MAG: CPBP family intramembrane glutamate endopeptidase, partial [Flavobacteriaceae bacterium]
MYISQAKEYTKWWKYLIGAVIIVAGIFIFSIPHAIAIGVKLASGGLDPTRLEDVNYLMQAFEPNLNLIFILLPFIGMLLGTFLAVRYVHGQPLLKLTTSRSSVDWNRAAFAFILWGAFTSFMLLIDYAVLSPENYQWNFKLQPFLILCVIAAILLPIQTSAEEYLFR